MTKEKQESVSPEDAVLTADALKAMGHPLRWRILCALGDDDIAGQRNLKTTTKCLPLYQREQGDQVGAAALAPRAPGQETSGVLPHHKFLISALDRSTMRG